MSSSPKQLRTQLPQMQDGVDAVAALGDVGFQAAPQESGGQGEFNHQEPEQKQQERRPCSAPLSPSAGSRPRSFLSPSQTSWYLLRQAPDHSIEPTPYGAAHVRRQADKEVPR